MGRSGCRRRSRAVVVAAGLLVVADAGLGVAGAGSPPFTATPTEVVAGDAITVAGVDCVPPFDDPTFGQVVLSTPDGVVLLAANYSPVDETGAWGGALPIPADLAPGTYDLDAFCMTRARNAEIPDVIILSAGPGTAAVDEPVNPDGEWALISSPGYPTLTLTVIAPVSDDADTTAPDDAEGVPAPGEAPPGIPGAAPGTTGAEAAEPLAAPPRFTG